MSVSTSPRSEHRAFTTSTPGFFNDPYAEYARWRNTERIHRHPDGIWFLFGYDDCRMAMREASQLSNQTIYARDVPRNRRLAELMSPDVVFRPDIARSDDPLHARLRKVAARPFTPKAIAGMQSRVQALVTGLLAPFGPGDEIDVMTAVSRRLPYQIACDILGFPMDSSNESASATETAMITSAHAFTAVAMDPFLTDEQMTAAMASAGAIGQYLTEMIAWKRAHPGDDVTSKYLAAVDAGEIDEIEAFETIFTLFLGGFETTATGIANALYALLSHPDQWQALTADPGLMPTAIEECLRYDNTIQIGWRTTPKPIQINGIDIPAGEHVVPVLGSANRDELKWGDTANTLDITRTTAKEHLSFGIGPHVCIGAFLARAEMSSVIGAIAERYPSTELVTESPTFDTVWSLRGPEELVVRLR